MSTLQLLNQRPVNEIDAYSNLRYDYSRIEDESARERVRRAAVQIKPRLKRAAEDLFVIGQELVSIKEYLGHGEWGEWLATEFGLSDRMARNFMNVSLRLGSKTEKFSVLPVSALYELAAPSTSPEVIQQVEGKIEIGTLPSLTDIRAWKGVQRQQRLKTLTVAIDSWVDAQQLAGDETIQLLNSLQAEAIEVPSEVRESIIDPTSKEIGQAIEQSLTQRQQLTERDTTTLTPAEEITQTSELDTTLSQALALLQDEKNRSAYARLTGNDTHLAKAIQSLKRAMKALASIDGGQ